MSPGIMLLRYGPSAPLRSITVVGLLWLATMSVPCVVAAQVRTGLDREWDAAAATAYLDQRAAWWLSWPNAARDHETSCISCHTTLPYALARPALRRTLREPRAVAPETEVLNGVQKRVLHWDEVEPFYPDQRFGLPKSSESRGTEAVLNALVLAQSDAGDEWGSDLIRRAFDNLWELQFTRGDGTGAWAWLHFDLAPWESSGAEYFGAALAAVAAGVAPAGSSPKEVVPDRLDLLRSYLLADWQARPVFDRLMLLWAGSELAGLLTDAQARSIAKDLDGLQNTDGGWSLSSLRSWTRRDGSEQSHASDGYATGLVTYVLQRAGSSEDGPIGRGLTWLARHQDPATGAWHTSSLNTDRDPDSERGLFMSDAATAFAVLALTEAELGGR